MFLFWNLSVLLRHSRWWGQNKQEWEITVGQCKMLSLQGWLRPGWSAGITTILFYLMYMSTSNLKSLATEPVRNALNGGQIHLTCHDPSLPWQYGYCFNSWSKQVWDNRFQWICVLWITSKGFTKHKDRLQLIYNGLKLCLKIIRKQ